MKSVRIIFTKKDNARFVSHLDMNRLMIRLIRKSGIDIWYTEGFNPHPYITFALPLTLGFESDYEIMDIKVLDDNYDINEIPGKLNDVSPNCIRFVKAFEPKEKVNEIAFATYDVVFDDKGEIFEKLTSFLSEPSIIAHKRTKKGDIKDIDLAPKIKSYRIEKMADDTFLEITLPAGSTDNVNPTLLLDAFYEKNPHKYFYYDITRTDILNSNLEKFS